MALLKRVLLFCLSIVLIIFYLIGATTSYAKEQTSAEKLLDSVIGYYTEDQTYNAVNLGWQFYTDSKYRNFEIAYNFTKIAAENKHPYAINNFGVMYEEGYAVNKDVDKAFR